MPPRRPRLKIIRRLGTQLPGLTRKSADRKPAPPGQHGASAGRRRPSAFRKSLEEKQKVRLNYGVSERQMRRYLERARTMTGRTGANLLMLLEQRLDNVVFRLGLAPTIPAARQLVSHGHVAVNGNRVDRPGYEVQVGDEIGLTTKAAGRAAEQGVPQPVLRLPSYLAREGEATSGRMIAPPSRNDVPFSVDEGLIVEFYAR
jgi:small subunit ribosomal protein S4